MIAEIERRSESADQRVGCRLSWPLSQLKIDSIDDVSGSDLFDIMFSGMPVAGE
jgi:hypothetical protein